MDFSWQTGTPGKDKTGSCAHSKIKIAPVSRNALHGLGRYEGANVHLSLGGGIDAAEDERENDSMFQGTNCCYFCNGSQRIPGVCSDLLDTPHFLIHAISFFHFFEKDSSLH